MNRAHAPKTTLRMPPDVIAWLKTRAAHNVSSMTAELVRVCRDRMTQDRHAARKAEVSID